MRDSPLTWTLRQVYPFSSESWPRPLVQPHFSQAITFGLILWTPGPSLYFPNSGFFSGLSTPTFPLSQGTAPFPILCPTAIQPQPRVYWNELYTIPNIMKEFFCPSPSKASVSMKVIWWFVPSIKEKVLLTETPRVVLLQLPCFSLLHFPKVSRTYVPRDLKVTTSEFSQNSGHPSQKEVNLLASVVFLFLQSTWALG